METKQRFDVVIIGGALSGSATALQILRSRPQMRVAVVEKAPVFGRRVGESTVEVSAYFLGKHLGLSSYLNREHIAKQGLRFLFANERTKRLQDCSEVGPKYNVRMPGYQVDRALLDEEVLRRAQEAGAVLFRPAKVRGVELEEGRTQRTEVELADGSGVGLESRWVVDASGLTSVVGRKLGLIEVNEAHPIASVWARYRGVKNLDDRSRRKGAAAWMDRVHAVRETATNHLVGDGYWVWVIPLANGDTSIGVVYDERLVTFPKEGSLEERLRAFVCQHPAGATLLEGAEAIPGDCATRRRLAYRARQFMGDGWALVGDAAGFMDPFYSPGMDWIAFTTGATAKILTSRLDDTSLPLRLARHNQYFGESYDRWFDAIYRDKYYYQGDCELMFLAFQADLATYYAGVIERLLRGPVRRWHEPPFSHEASTRAAKLLALFNQRMAAMGRSRRARGTFGRANTGRFIPFTSYEFDYRLRLRMAGLVGQWLLLELREGWRTWFTQPEPEAARKPVVAVP